jgi:hypothetical protein
MKTMVGVLLLVLAQPAWSSEAPPGCAWLCGKWVLDVASSEPAEPVVDTALEKFRGPGPSIKAQVRAQMLTLLSPPTTLELGEQGKQVLIRWGDSPERRVFPGEPHSRVDALGTAKIRGNWKKDALTINESYGSKREQTETYTLLPDGTLQLTLVLERPEAKVMRLRSIYRRR